MQFVVVELYLVSFFFFFFNDTAPPEIYPLPLPDAPPIPAATRPRRDGRCPRRRASRGTSAPTPAHPPLRRSAPRQGSHPGWRARQACTRPRAWARLCLREIGRAHV